MAGLEPKKPVRVSLKDLQSNSIHFTTLEAAFGPQSLGILLVSDLPSAFPSLRSKVLTNSTRLASLPESELQDLTKPKAKYLTGWSHGVETLKPGIIDTQKGSYYINCNFYNAPSSSSSEISDKDAEKFPGFEEYTSPNIWPQPGSIPQFQEDAEALISLIIDVAVLVARACDRYAEERVVGYEKGYLERVVQTSRTSKARLLHYFPTEAKAASTSINGHNAETEQDDSWCATHLDHGCLTGLTSAMFLDESSPTPLSEIASPDPDAGLYILSRSDTTTKVSIPRDCLAFQTGEALQLVTKGKFKAVPHYVRGARCAGRVARNTLAVFTQPNLDEVVDLDSKQTFGEFAKGVVKKNTVG